MLKKISKINLKNPISHEEVNRMIQIILVDKKPNFLLINYGDHEFKSIEILRYCKVELMNIQELLMKFKKIAFVSIPPYKNEDSGNLKYFYSEDEAKEWFLADE